MKSFKAKLAILLIAIFTITMLIPVGKVSAANEGIQLIKTADDNIVIYVEGLEKEAFDYALSTTPSATEMDLNYINSVLDEEANQVAVVTTDELAANNYIYIRKNGEEKGTPIQINADVNTMFTQDKMSLVENTTKRISTEVLKDLEQRNETVDGITYVERVGGLKITDDQNATYSYVMKKVTSEGTDSYSQLQSLANELNNNYESKSMYSKIEFANEFYNLYNELIKNADWQPVENMEVRQPIEAQDGDQYVVMLKKVAADGTTTYDAKFMTSYLEKDEEKINPAYTDKKVTQETSKLPITGDSIALFVVLAALIIVAIIVFVKMKKANKKADK